jgi:NAD-dependent deacetylase
MNADSLEIPDSLVAILCAAKRVAVLTGSGISAESGVPTFREAQTGLWARYDPHQLATPEAFQNNPQLVWEWYAWRRELVSLAKPNPGHLALAHLAKMVPELNLITQNVDSLHQRAGSKDVIELHGNITRTRCSADGEPVESWDEIGESPPRCPRCYKHLRPDVVWFGEPLPETSFMKAVEIAENCDVFFSIGTSAFVQPAASLPLYARRQDAILVEINMEQTPLTPLVDYALWGQAGDILPRIVQAASIH